MAELPPNPTIQQDHNHHGKRKQLSQAMEHIRYAVTVPLTASSSSTPAPDQEAGPQPPSTEPNVYGMPGYIQPMRKPKTESAQNSEKRSDPFQFGSRYLEEGDDIFAYNAWDHVETDETYQKFAEEMYEKQRSEPVSDFDKKRFNDNPEKWWNKFYSNNTSNFFKDRKWLHQEFPLLSELSQPDAPPAVILEVGAGAGNTAFPVMKLNQNPNLVLHACDFSKKAVEVIQSNPEYTSTDMIGTLHASVWDIAAAPNADLGEPTLPEGLQPGSVDVVVLIFIFSALAPSQWPQALWNIWHLLKPGGIVLFRDYGRGDLAQVRFRKGRYMEENFYVRGDGTRVYFFDEKELRELWSGISTISQPEAQSLDAEPEETNAVDKNSSLDDQVAELHLNVPNKDGYRPKFEVVNFGVDRRMLVNRQRRLKMYRCWMQAKFRKPENS